ncbi:Phosphate-import ATP-binding protein PhnC [Pseudovibrio axinellae]|uniref:Phosphate-import ATP-binding protein PhnC n=1 Tax=Pseudovibrio axinellae TaxID=989403 RepID=A0A161VD31_9HYPH|nr:ATP-binding cassette domain-containing protein [Pseudovibrio axinellae]KZL22154.1 Phosphate-import ATP-binding protein PhnC [Pseudovibrio axinellae]SEQ53191.1 phosphonate transport system ATP-binding protein [Pseudovibrio axinellae]
MTTKTRQHPAVTLSSVSHQYSGARQATLDAVSLTIPKRERVALIGPSGAGKSSLLALLDGRLASWTGQASVLGKTVLPGQKLSRAHRADIGFVFQEFALIERASVWQNVLNGRLGRMGTLASLMGRFSVEDERAVTQALEDVDLIDLTERRTDQLSGGQRQRVAIARCLAQEPKLILADEPISNLDPMRAEAVLQLLTSLAAKRDITVIFSSHQPELASKFADRILSLADGKIIVDRPTSELTSLDMRVLYQASEQPQLLRKIG